MKKSNNILALAVLSASITSYATANDSFAPGDSDSKWVLGGGGVVSTNIYAGEDNFGAIYPNVEYRGDRFFFKQGTLGFSALTMGDFSAGVVLTPDVSFLVDDKEYRKNLKLKGLKERDATIEGGFYVNHTTNMGRLNLTVLTDLANKHDGQSVSLSYTADLEFGGWNVNPYLGVGWVSDDKVNHHFGVSSAEATLHRAAYKAKNTTNGFAGVRGRYAFNDHWDINLTAGVTRYGSGITDSSIVDEKTAYHGSVAINYNF